jgi:formylglycine-generating enzyme required for sulfatase activity
MIAIPGGKFYMGSDERDAIDRERPAHQVTLAPYCMDEYEVTTTSYKACSDKGECKRAGKENEWTAITKKEREVFDPLCNARDPEGKAQHPINCVDWDMATKFCTVAGKRLPTEAEWEFAARGPDGRKYPWGDETPTAEHLNACGTECVAWGKAHGQDLRAMYAADDGHATTAPVGSYPAGRSRYGVHDVVGNVWEWTADFYADYTKDEQISPKGPAHGERRVIRGGAWNGSEPAWVRPTFRYHDVPTKRSYGIGFRCAL